MFCYVCVWHLIKYLILFHFMLNLAMEYLNPVALSSKSLKVHGGATNKLLGIFWSRLILCLFILLYGDRLVNHAHDEALNSSSIDVG